MTTLVFPLKRRCNWKGTSLHKVPAYIRRWWESWLYMWFKICYWNAYISGKWS